MFGQTTARTHLTGKPQADGRYLLSLACVGLLTAPICAIDRAPDTDVEPIRTTGEDLESSDFESLRAASVAELVERMDGLARWYHENGLAGERDRAYVLILHCDPDHRDARRYLKYSRRKGEWKQRSSYRPPKNRKPEFLEEGHRRRSEAVASHRDLLLGRLSSGWAAIDQPAREALIEELLALDPDDSALHAACGESWDPRSGSWVLTETGEAEVRRDALLEGVRNSLCGDVESTLVEPNELESELGLPWTGVYDCGRVHVLGTVAPSELEKCAHHVEAVLRLFEDAFDGRRVRPFVVYLLDGAGRREDFLAAHPGWDTAAADDVRGRTGGWAPNSDQLALWEPTAEGRLETAVEQAAVWALVTSYGVDDRQGWLIHGVRAYLVETLLGRSRQLAGAQWNSIVKALPEDVGALLELSTDQLGASERLTSYALVRYLIECRVDAVSDVLSSAAAEEDPVHRLELALETRADVLSSRLHRWVEEAGKSTRRAIDTVASSSRPRR